MLKEIINLPDGTDVPIERIYVSLQTDAMNAKECEAEHDFYLEEVEAIWHELADSAPDRYTESTALRQAVSRRPYMQKLITCNWQMVFAKQRSKTLNLAEVMARHPRVVVLGNPGNGKTKLGRWLILQFARVRREGHATVQVRADEVHPGTEATRLDRW